MAQKRINSRTKGKRAERAVAKLFEEWTGYEFGSTPGSGALRWQKRTFDTASDLVCLDEKHSRKFPFTIEVKSYKELDFDKLIYPSKCKIKEFYKQAIGDAERADKYPLLFMRSNGLKKDFYYVAMPQALWYAISVTHDTKDFPAIWCFGEVSFALVSSTHLLTLDYHSIYKLIKKLRKQENENRRRKISKG